MVGLKTKEVALLVVVGFPAIFTTLKLLPYAMPPHDVMLVWTIETMCSVRMATHSPLSTTIISKS
jgi:hypothetical protein